MGSEKRLQSSLHGCARLEVFLVALAVRLFATRVFGALRFARAMVAGLGLNAVGVSVCGLEDVVGELRGFLLGTLIQGGLGVRM